MATQALISDPNLPSHNVSGSSGGIGLFKRP